MKFTEEDMKRQQARVAELQAEFERLNAEHDRQKRATGYTKEAVSAIDMEAMPKAMKDALLKAQADAKKAGEARAAQSKLDAPVKPAKAPGTGRRNAIRL